MSRLNIEWRYHRTKKLYRGTGTGNLSKYEFLVKRAEDGKCWTLWGWVWVPGATPLARKVQTHLTELSTDHVTVRLAKEVAEQYMVTPGPENSLARVQRAITAATGSEVQRKARKAVPDGDH